MENLDTNSLKVIEDWFMNTIKQGAYPPDRYIAGAIVEKSDGKRVKVSKESYFLFRDLKITPTEANMNSIAPLVYPTLFAYDVIEIAGRILKPQNKLPKPSV